MFKSILFLTIIFSFNESISQVDSLNKRLIYEGEISLGGAYLHGDLNLFTIKGSYESSINYKNISSNTFLQYTYNNTFSKIIQNDFFGYDIISLNKKKRFHPEIALMYEKSKVKSVDHHYYSGFGIGWNAITKEKYNLSITNAIAFEKNEFLINKSLNYEGIRYSMIIKGNYVLLKNKLIINHKFFLNPFLINSTNNLSAIILRNASGNACCNKRFTKITSAGSKRLATANSA